MGEGHKKFAKALFTKSMLLTFAFGFSSGLPAVLIGSNLKIWLTREGLSLSTIGFMSWVGIGIGLKFLWAPLMDRWSLGKLGRRRSWIAASQILLMILMIWLGSFDPKQSLLAMAITSVFISFVSATQDIAIDAYRRESLSDEQMGLGSSLYQYGYRVAMYVSGGLGLGLVGSDLFGFTWGQVYMLMGLLMGACVLFTLTAAEDPPPKENVPQGFEQIVLSPFLELFSRPGAIFLLLFTILFKFGDAIAGSMLGSFYVKMGYSNQDIALIAKTIGPIAGMVGLFLGGTLLYYMPIYRALLIFGVFQILSTALFPLITYTGPKAWALAAIIVAEDLSTAMGSAAFIAFLSMVTNKKYTGTQFALLSSLAFVGKIFFSGFGGEMALALGWANFFYLCALIGIPGLVMLIFMKRSMGQET